MAREDAAARRAAAETVTEPEPDQAIEVDGVLRFNFFVEDLDEAVKDKRCDNGLDLFRLSADGRYKDVLISADYRWYPFMQTLHHGWVGYELAHGGPWNLQLAFYLLQEPRDR
ncbi:MAG: hypothetical protein GWO02_00915 [Gammaproteobacteria bacterium]|nr:hypothetical protein [Gammaproteobacteria bacterium]